MWPKEIDKQFRAAYLEKTGEHIQDQPLESEDGLSLMVGSSRVTDQQLAELKADSAISPDPKAIRTDINKEPLEWAAKKSRVSL